MPRFTATVTFQANDEEEARKALSNLDEALVEDVSETDEIDTDEDEDGEDDEEI